MASVEMIERTEEEMFKSLATRMQWTKIRSEYEGLILDIGCYDGLLASSHPSAIGLEVDNVSSKIPVVNGDMHRLPFPNEHFDTVSMCHVLEHTATPHVVLSECNRVLKKNGKLIIAVPNAGASLAKLTKTILGYDGYAYNNKTKEFWDHKYFFDRTMLENMISQNGFVVIDSWADIPYLPGRIIKIFNHRPLDTIGSKLGSTFKTQSLDLLVVARKKG